MTVNITGSGSVTQNPDKSTYDQRETVSLTANPGPGFTFGNWTGNASGTANPVTLTMDGNKTITATFTAVPDGFVVAPLAGLSASGRQGGPFDLSVQTYTLQNGYDVPIKWRVTKKPRWVVVSPMNGSLAKGGTVQVRVSLGNMVKQLRPGSYEDTIIFSGDANPGDSISRPITLTIKPAIKTYTVTTRPEELQVIVDGVAFSSPQIFEWEVGSSHTLDAASPPNGFSWDPICLQLVEQPEVPESNHPRSGFGNDLRGKLHRRSMR